MILKLLKCWPSKPAMIWEATVAADGVVSPEYWRQHHQIGENWIERHSCFDKTTRRNDDATAESEFDCISYNTLYCLTSALSAKLLEEIQSAKFTSEFLTCLCNDDGGSNSPSPSGKFSLPIAVAIPEGFYLPIAIASVYAMNEPSSS